MRAAVVAALMGSACDRRFFEVEPGIEWVAWIELASDGAITDASPLFEVGETAVFAVGVDEVDFVGFAGLGTAIRGSGARWAEEPLILASACDPKLAPSWRGSGADLGDLPPLTAPWAIAACGAVGITTPACASCRDCGLERIDHEIVFPGVSTEAVLHAMVRLDSGLFLGSLRPPALEPMANQEHLAMIRIDRGLPVATATPLPGISRSIVVTSDGPVVATSTAILTLDSSGAILRSVRIPANTHDEVGLAGAPSSVFAFVYKEPAFELAASSSAAVERIDLPDDIYDLAVDPASGELAALTIGRIDRCLGSACDRIFLEDTTYVALDFDHRARVALIDGRVVFGWKGQSVRRHTPSGDWEELGWPAADTEPRAFASFAGGILIGGHTGQLDGVIYFERGDERCTLGVDGRGVNGLVVLPDERRAFAVAGSPLNERLVELRAR